MQKIVQCVPNFSEGKDLDKIERIVAPLKNKEGVKLVGVEPDETYNRTVVTVIGEPQAVKNAVIEAIGVATQEIDLNHHKGEHKRMGATDVVPFIPIAEMSIEDAVELSKECAAEVAKRFDLPVFLYSHSAQQPNREKLPTIRKGEFEGMGEKIKLPEWKPDYGKAEIHPTAGVVAIGCRPPLIAYNIDCATKDIDAISFIAKSIRLSGGGYKCIQAGPAEYDEFIQVTMNVTDYTQTAVYRAFEAVKMEAKRFNIEVTGSEIIGLVPRKCLEDIAAYYLCLRNTDTLQSYTLEQLAEVVTEHLGLRGFSLDKIIEYHI
ncbi:glutamate formimidoyltransferase [Erysipelotrichaceae bacterium OttesenSCG-928-M19]|nr:glutamate formimidoyltransferase [Erysipelotrichaceae bacterium OttesenSCG-928-M19]